MFCQDYVLPQSNFVSHPKAKHWIWVFLRCHKSILSFSMSRLFQFILAEIRSLIFSACFPPFTFCDSGLTQIESEFMSAKTHIKLEDYSHQQNSYIFKIWGQFICLEHEHIISYHISDILSKNTLSSQSLQSLLYINKIWTLFGQGSFLGGGNFIR